MEYDELRRVRRLDSFNGLQCSRHSLSIILTTVIGLRERTALRNATEMVVFRRQRMSPTGINRGCCLVMACLVSWPVIDLCLGIAAGQAIDRQAIL